MRLIQDDFTAYLAARIASYGNEVNRLWYIHGRDCTGEPREEISRLILKGTEAGEILNAYRYLKDMERKP